MAKTLIFEDKELKYGYYLYLDAEAEPQSGRRKALNFLWTKYAKRYFSDVKPQVIPLKEYARYVLNWAFRCYEDVKRLLECEDPKNDFVQPKLRYDEGKI